METLAPDQLEQAQTKLIAKTRQARGDHDYLTQELSRLIIGHALGTVTHDEIREARRQISECVQVMEETPAALALVKELIEQARSHEAQELRREETKQAQQAYFELRQTIIDNPSLADRYEAPGRLNSLSVSAWGPHKNGEVRELVAAAQEYNSRKRSEPFSFNVTISE